MHNPERHILCLSGIYSFKYDYRVFLLCCVEIVKVPSACVVCSYLFLVAGMNVVINSLHLSNIFYFHILVCIKLLYPLSLITKFLSSVGPLTYLHLLYSKGRSGKTDKTMPKEIKRKKNIVHTTKHRKRKPQLHESYKY